MKLPKWVCHQIPERSFRINNKQFILCSRCTGLYFGLIVGFLISLTFGLGALFNKTEILVIGFVMCSPLAIDGVIQLLKWRESNNALRLATGILAGLFCGLGLTYLFFT